jgi:hypothetical protein
VVLAHSSLCYSGRVLLPSLEEALLVRSSLVISLEDEEEAIYYLLIIKFKLFN